MSETQNTALAANDLIASTTGVLYRVIHGRTVKPIGKGPLRDIPKTYRIIARADDADRIAIIREYRESKTLPETEG